MNTTTYSFKEIFKEQERNLGKLTNSNIHKNKVDAFDNFYDMGFPTRKNEAWKYTNVHSFTRASLNPLFFPENHLDIKKSDFRNYQHIKANRLVVVNGSFQQHLSEIIEDPEDVYISSISDAILNENPTFEKYFNTIADNENEPFTALNTAMFGDGIFIHVKENRTAKYPIIWFFISKNNSNCIINPRNLIVVEKNASAQIIKDHQGLTEGDYFINAHSEIFIDKNSNLNMTTIQNETSHGLHYIGTKKIYQEKDSIVNFTNIALSGKLIRNNLHSVLNDENISCTLKGLYYGKGEDIIDNNYLIEHKAKHCFSDQLIKGILTDDSNANFTGKIHVHKGADFTNAYQRNNNLLLSDAANINSRPQLEIYADEVKCSHGATNGQIDENALYYLKSRGLTSDVAYSFLQYAFLREVFDNIENQGIKEYLDEVFRYKLGLQHI